MVSSLLSFVICGLLFWLSLPAAWLLCVCYFMV